MQRCSTDAASAGVAEAAGGPALRGGTGATAARPFRGGTGKRVCLQSCVGRRVYCDHPPFAKVSMCTMWTQVDIYLTTFAFPVPTPRGSPGWATMHEDWIQR